MDYYVILNHILSIWSLTDKLSKKDKTIGKPNKSFPSSEVAHVPIRYQLHLATPLRLIIANLLLPHAHRKQMGTRTWVWFPCAHSLPPALPPPESAGVPEGMMERGVFS